jgi:hypothetical protein
MRERHGTLPITPEDELLAGKVIIVFLYALGICMCPGIEGHCGQGGGTGGTTALSAEIKAMKNHNPDKYRDFRHVLRHIRTMNRRQDEKTSLAVAKALVDHVYWERYRFTSEEHRLNFLSVLMGIVRVESAFDPAAVSNRNARGLMQVHWPTWKRYFSSPEEAHDLRRNLTVGTGILRHYMRRSNNDLRRALYRYLGAPDDRYADKVIESAAAFKARVLSDPMERPVGEEEP